MDLRALLGPDGPIARAHPAFEVRAEQLRMMEAVETALRTGRHLLVEAGTGVGKTFAYLLPLLRHALDTQKPVTVSTHTINLQSQILDKDVPFLQGALPWKFTAALGKGRSNYVCLRRLDLAREQMRIDAIERAELERIVEWASATADGSRSDLPGQPPDAVWSQVQSERDNCMGRRSPHFEGCFYQAARRRLQSANLLVLNHHLFFSDLVLREEGLRYLPETEVAVLDEAHTLPEVAHRHFGLEVSNYQVRFLLHALHHPQKGSGFLAGRGGSAEIEAVTRALEANGSFFDGVAKWLRGHPEENGRMRLRAAVADPLSDALRAVADRLEAMLLGARSEEEQFETQAHWRKTEELAVAVADFVDHSHAGHVYWAEEAARSGRVTVRASPVDVGPLLKTLLFDRFRCAVLTSATLGVGKDRSLAYLRRNLGIEDALELQVGSPFDYARQVALYLDRGMPDPRDRDAWLSAVAQRVNRHVRESRGSAFVLFTSFEHMNHVHAALARDLEADGIPVMKQGEGLDRHQMLDRFKREIGSVIFGVDSFWQGVDVPGAALENVIITKLPFPVPSDPLVAAKSEAIEEQGGNAFQEFLLPETIIKLRQGFGRLIRSRTDRGRVVILDSRVLTKSYGRTVLDSLPACRLIVEE